MSEDYGAGHSQRKRGADVPFSRDFLGKWERHRVRKLAQSLGVTDESGIESLERAVLGWTYGAYLAGRRHYSERDKPVSGADVLTAAAMVGRHLRAISKAIDGLRRSKAMKHND